MTDQRVITWWQFQRQLTASARMMNQIEKQLLAEGWHYNHLTDTWEQEVTHVCSTRPRRSHSET